MDDRRKDALAKNEVLFREVNEQVDALDRQSEWAAADLVDFLCECSRVECLERIKVSRGEYERVRESPIRFILVPGHDIREIETVVERNDRFWVVEKTPGQRDIARAGDPRNGS